MVRARRVVLCLLACLLLFPVSPSPAIAQNRLPSVDSKWICASFDAWVWAQTAYDAAPDTLAHLDENGDGVACPELPVMGTFGPVLWTDRIPEGVEAAQVVGVTDGDTFTVNVNGIQDTIRMYHIDTPETSNFAGGVQCGGDKATDFLSYVLRFAPNSTVYLEYDETQRDRFDRRLAYVWYQIGDDVYFVNDVMVRHGWAESETYKPDVKYKDVLDAAEQFSIEKVLGVRLECGKFGQPNDGTAGPSSEQIRQAWQNQPNQGQLPPFPGTEPTAAPQPTAPPAPADPAPAPTQPPYIPPTEAPAPPPTGDCDPSYPDFCLAPAWSIGDLDCGDIGYRRFTVYPPDTHNFDGDFDGVGCEG